MSENYTITSTNPAPEIQGPRRQRIESIVSDVFSKELVLPTLTAVSDLPGALQISLAQVSVEGRREFRERIEEVMMSLDIRVSTDSADGPLTPVTSYRDDDTHEFTPNEITEVAAI